MKHIKRMGNLLAWMLALALIFVVVLNLGVTVGYLNFFSHAQAQFWIPGLATGFVPQGFDYVDTIGGYLISGYQKDHEASRIYIRFDDGRVHEVRLQRLDGTAYTEHAGGVAVNGDFIYLPGSGGLDVFRLSDILENQTATCIGQIPMEYDGDCCTFYDGYLFVGDFYHPGTYETPKEHHMTTPAGDANKAVIAVYKADASAEFGMETLPVAAISIGEKVQGMAFTEDGRIVLSTSYGIASSCLWFYAPDGQSYGTLTLQGREVPLYFLDSGNLTHSVAMPPMSEEVVSRNGRIHVLFESASSKYLFGNLIRGTHVYGYEEKTPS